MICLHFAAEMVLEIISKILLEISRSGDHISQEKARIDYQWPDNISVIFPEVRQECEDIILSDLEIISKFSDEKEQRRYWEVKGFSRVPCGGTHLRRTGEVGEIKLKRRNPGKRKERVEIELCED